MYTITRQDAAEKLSMSTRSIDRYIKSGKLRSRKEWKIIYIHEGDVNNILGVSQDKGPEVIIPEEKKASSPYSTQNNTSSERTHSTSIMDAQSRATLEKIYLDLRQEIKHKDQAIQDLSLKLGQAQEIAKNSVSLVEFKKSQFLLEESKTHLSQELTHLREQGAELQKKLKYEKSTNYILITFCVLLMIGFWLLWFLKI